MSPFLSWIFVYSQSHANLFGYEIEILLHKNLIGRCFINTKLLYRNTERKMRKFFTQKSTLLTQQSLSILKIKFKIPIFEMAFYPTISHQNLF